MSIVLGIENAARKRTAKVAVLTEATFLQWKTDDNKGKQMNRKN